MTNRAPNDPRLQGWSEQLYRSLVERVPAVVYIDSNDQRPDSLYLSPQIRDLLGHPPEAFLADPALWYRFVHPEDAPRIADAWRVARTTGASFEHEYRLIRDDGAVIWIRDGAVPVRDEDGNIVFWQGVLYDITAGKRHEHQLEEARERYQALVENLPAVVYLVAPDDDRRTLWVSPQVEQALGYAREEWLEQPDIWMELLHPEDREPALAALDAHNETGEPWSREYRLIASDGRAVWFRDVARLARDAEGRPRFWQGVQLDITELKEAEAELRRAHDELERRVEARTSDLAEANELMALEIGERRRTEADLADAERKYRLLAEQIPAVTYTWGVGQAMGEAYTSPRLEELLGYTVEEWHRDPDFWLDRLHPDDRRAVLAATIRSETTGEPFSMEYRYLHKDGHIVWVQDEAVLMTRGRDGSPSLLQGVMLDITARKEAEAKAVESEHRYRDLTEQVPGIIYVTESRPGSANSIFTHVGPQIREILGLEPEAWQTENDWLASVHPDDREEMVALSAEIAAHGEPWTAEYRMLRADGSSVRVRDRGRVLERDAAGHPRVYQGLVVDISDERAAARTVSEALDRYRLLVEQIPAIVYIQAPTQRRGEAVLLYLSSQTEAIIGYSADELMADPSHLDRLLHPDDRDRVVEADMRAERTGEPFDEEYRVIAKDGRIVWLHSHAVLVTDDGGRPRYWHGVALDVTERRTAQDRLRALEERYEQLAGRAFRTLGLDAGA
ncbi:MAG TPA: PAS domain-containing protein [Actinomycetota bacterium]|nr:PAS domain-containing protein [Actinomycetota bacterium]